MYYSFQKKKLIFTLYDEILCYIILTQLIVSLLYLIYLNINKKRKTEKLLNGNENNSFKLTQYRGGDLRPTSVQL